MVRFLYPLFSPMMRFLYSLLILSWPLLVRGEWDEIPELLPKEEGSLVSVQLGLPENGHVIAFGHFTADRRLDCLVLDQSGNQLSVYIMKPSEGRYYKSLANAVVPKENLIIGAVMSDFDHDGWSDVLVMYRGREGGNQKVSISLFLGDGETLRPSNWNISPAKGEVFPIDYTGELQLSLLGVSGSAADRSTYLWKNKATSRNELATDFQDPVIVPSFGQLSSPGWHAQADVNGDGHADLLLMTGDSSLEIWLRKLTESADAQPYKLDSKISLPLGAGPLVTADVDGDGHLDIIFAVCYPVGTCSAENSLHVMFNVQRRFCTGGKKDKDLPDCVHPGEELFTPEGAKFKFDPSPGTSDHLVIPINKVYTESPMRVLFTDPLTNEPVSMNVGDYDLDAYPDLAVVLIDQAQLKGSRAIVLHNVPCTDELCSGPQVAAGRRTFVDDPKGMDVLRSLRGVTSVAFADWYDIGPPGFIVNQYDPSNHHATHRSIKNAISRDAFSLRTETLNGVCPSPCRSIKTGAKAERPIGVNYVGASCRFSFVGPEGATQVRSGTQLSQTANRALQSPTLLFGLGRTSNFVQFLEVGLPGFSTSTFTKSNIFPNSEIIFSPPHADSAGWRAELQISPGEYMLYVFVSVAMALLVLAVITGIFKLKERKEDEVERRKATHLINFDAL